MNAFLLWFAAWATPLAVHLLSLAIQTLVIVAAGLVVSRLLRRSAPSLRHLLWAVILLRLAIPIAPVIPAGLPGAGVLSRPLSIEMAVGGAGGGRVPSPVAVPGASELAAVVLVTAWLAGIAILGLGLLFRSRRWRRRLRLESQAAEAETLEAVERVARRVGVSRPPRVRRLLADSRLPAPVVWGVFRPVLILPHQEEEPWETGGGEAVLLHELVHLRRMDPWIHLLQRCVELFYFFHPMVWIASRRLSVERELACDDEVLRLCGKRDSYLRALLALAEKRRPPAEPTAALAMAEPVHLLVRRIRRMTMIPSREVPAAPNRRQHLSVLVLAVALLLLAAACPRVQVRKAPEEPMILGVGNVTAPQLIPESRVQPTYPKLAKKARIEAKVILQVVIRKDGTVSDIEVLKEPADKTLGFRQAAIDAVKQWRYEPATLNGEPVPVYLTIVSNFTSE